MNALLYVLRELRKMLLGYPWTLMASFLALTLLFLLFNAFWIGAISSERFYHDLLADMQMEVFIAEEIPDSALVHIEKFVERLSGVESVDYVSRQRAREELSSLIGIDLLVGYDEVNPLPRSFVLSFPEDSITLKKMQATETELRRIEGVVQINYSKAWLTKAENTKQVIFRLGMIIGALILGTALLNSANYIRLLTRARAVGLRQMRLLGASKTLLAGPFVIEGFLLGGVSSVAGWLIIYYGLQYISFVQITIGVPPLNQLAMFCGGASILGALSGYIGVRGLLRDDAV